MRKSILTLSVLLSCCINAFSQEYSQKYGKVTEDELNMSVYTPDSSASALCIFDKCKMEYQYMNGFNLVYEFEKKIKILKQDGTDEGSIAIRIHKDERLINLSAMVYNMENGKIEKTKLDKKYIFDEKTDDNWITRKISFPSVKAGSVIEYKYTLKTDDFHPQTRIMQKSIPVKYSELIFIYPEYFTFNMEVRGHKLPQHEHEEVNKTYAIITDNGSGNITCKGSYNKFVSEDLIAIKDNNNHLWYPNDYKTQINFELRSTQFPNSGVKSYTSTWDQIVQRICELEDFGNKLDMKNPFQEEVQALELAGKSRQEKIAMVFDLVKSKIGWNKEYRILVQNVRKALKEGEGNNAEINFILMAALRDAGIASAPVILSSRDRGILPIAIPSMKNLNSFVLAIPIDEELYYIDGSMKKPILNALPSALRVDRALVIDMTKKITNTELLSEYHKINRISNGNWVSLQRVSRPTMVWQVTAKINENEEITGVCKSIKTDIIGLGEMNACSNSKDSTKHLEKLEKELDTTISDFSLIYEKERSNQQFSFIKKPNMTNENSLYINPMIFPHLTSNPFQQEGRQFPVEFDYLTTHRMIISLEIPQGYVVEDIPQSMRLMTESNECEFNYHIAQQGNRVTISYVYKLNSIIFPTAQYESLKNFYGTMADKNKEMIVLRKEQL